MTKFTLSTFNGPTTPIDEGRWEQTFGKAAERKQVLRCEQHDALFYEGERCPECRRALTEALAAWAEPDW